MKSEFITAISQLAAEKNLPKEVVFEAVEMALASAYKKDNLAQANVKVKINAEDGTMDVFTAKDVVAEIEDENIQMTVDEARRIKPDAQLGDVLTFPATPANAGRIAAQTAKQVVLQRLREAEREVVYEEYAGKEGDIISAVVQRLEGRNVIVDVGKTEAVLPPPEQVRTEHYRPTQRLKVLLIEVFKAAKGPQVVVSRTHKDLLKRLFELEVPEIFRGIVEIKSIAREAGYRSKVAVYSRQEGVDPVGACVGMRGIRIQNVVNELNGERIDVVQWDPEPSRFVANALSPAQVVSVMNHDAENTAEVIVPDRQLSLAIGKEGQNARLAAKLTGWRIDIKSQTAYEAELAEKGITPEEAAAAAREEALKRSAAAAAAIAEEARQAAAQRPLRPEEEIALQFAERGEEPEPAAASGAPAPVAPPPAPEPVGAGSGKPAIRFAEELVRPPIDDFARPAAQKKRGGPPSRRRSDEEEAARIANLNKKKKSGGARRVLPTEDEDEEDDYSDMIR
ncbi:MAG: transcription termination/antitermination protein NusA [Dehalococcoidia bacterium]|nr:transcription termination/antitermination protein NusA [Dehalococcoidia bacterium]